MSNNPSIELLETNEFLNCSETESIEVYVPPESNAHSPLSRRSEMSPQSYESILICKDIDIEDELNKAKDDEEDDAFKILSISFYDRKQSFKSINLTSCDQSPKKSEDSDPTPVRRQNFFSKTRNEAQANPQQKYFQYYNLTSINKSKLKGSVTTTATTTTQNLGPRPTSTLFSIRESLHNTPLLHYETDPIDTIQTERAPQTRAIFDDTRPLGENTEAILLKRLSLTPRPKDGKIAAIIQTPEKQKSLIKPLGAQVNLKTEKDLFRRPLFQNLPVSSFNSKDIAKLALSDRNLKNTPHISPRGVRTTPKGNGTIKSSKTGSSTSRIIPKFQKPENQKQTHGPAPPSLSRNALLQIIEAKRATLSHIDSSKINEIFSEPIDCYFNIEAPKKFEKAKPIPQIRKLEIKTETKCQVPWKRLTPRDNGYDPIKFSPRNPQEVKIDFKSQPLENFKPISSPQNGKISKGLTNIKNVAILKKKDVVSHFSKRLFAQHHF